MDTLAGCFLVLLTAILLVIIGKSLHHRVAKTFPGPWSWPIIGHPVVFAKNVHVKLGRLADHYGDLFQIYVGQEPVVVLSSFEAARQAFSKLELSGRPSIPSLAIFRNEVKGEFAFRSFSDRCIFIRKAVIRSLGRLFREEKDQIENLALAAHNSLKQQLLEDEARTTDPDVLIHKAVISIVGPLSFGSQLNCKDPVFDQMLSSGQNFNKVMKFNFMANYCPFLTLFSRKDLELFRENGAKTNKFFYEAIRNHRRNDTVQDLQDALELEAEQCDQEELRRLGMDTFSLKHSATNVFGAGVFTTAEHYLWALRLLSVFPETQEKMSAEITNLENVTHFDGVVTLEHRKHLIYTKAFLEELFRFSSALPLGIPHSAMKSSKLRGYDIPKGCTVVANLWKINRDANHFDEPEEFMPERFIREDRSFNDDLAKKVVAFSVGKRKCIGESVARDELFLLITNLVNTFNVRFAGLVQGGRDFLQPTVGFSLKPIPALYSFSLRRSS
uniref:Cytochrome P450 n=1 Tax=Trichuris muris TaxID=70415 RepID=A0A5S6QRG5_TRIMR